MPLIFLFGGDDDDRRWHRRRRPRLDAMVHNACATQAILSILLNTPAVDVGEELAAFKAFTKDFPPELRGLAIGQSEIVRTAHNSFGRQEAFAVDEKRASEKDDEVTRAQFGAQFGAAL